MRLRTKQNLIRTGAGVAVVLLIVVSVLGFFRIIDGSSKPVPQPKYRVGQCVEMRFGTDQGLVMKVERVHNWGDVHYLYHVKFYYKNGREEIKKYRDIELELPRRR